LRARGETEMEAEKLLSQVGPAIQHLLGERIYSCNGKPLEAVVGDLLRVRGATLSVAESCTGGLLGERITSIAGSSDYFVGGFLVYNDRLKIDLLGLDPAILKQHTSVSQEAARAMAEGARARTGSTYALSVTGEAGPQSATGAPVGTVVIGFAGPEAGPEAERFTLFGERTGIRARAAQWALDYLRRRIQ
jgi:nicotinamide-nucleotide amidase